VAVDLLAPPHPTPQGRSKDTAATHREEVSASRPTPGLKADLHPRGSNTALITTPPRSPGLRPGADLDAETCVHHWLIDPPNGPQSEARCSNCGELTLFWNVERHLRSAVGGKPVATCVTCGEIKPLAKRYFAWSPAGWSLNCKACLEVMVHDRRGQGIAKERWAA
jgi:hypothetical protein